MTSFGIKKNYGFLFQTLNWYEKAGILIAVIVFGYTCIRAAILSITIDEAATYLWHVQLSFRQIFSHTWQGILETHLLNTLLIKIITQFLGNSEFAIRIPALIGHVLYLLWTVKTLKLFLKGRKFVLGLSLMVTNPYLLSFFSCARGYSLGLGFFMGGLYYFLKSTASGLSIKNNILAITMLTCSVLSNIGFLIVFLSVIGTLIIFEIKENLPLYRNSLFSFIKRLNKSVILPVIFSGLCLLIFYGPGKAIARIRGSNHWGGLHGFWSDTIGSLIYYMLYQKNYITPELVLFIKIFIFFILISGVFVLLYMFCKRNKVLLINKYLFKVVSMLILSAFIIKVQFILFGIRYPVNRTVIFLIPVFLILILVLWGHIYILRSKYARIISNGLFLCIIFILLIYNISCLNFSYYHGWIGDASTKKAMNLIYQLTNAKNAGRTEKYRIGIHWFFEPSTNYYIIKNRMDWIEKTNRDGPDGVYDYYYFPDSEKGRSLIKKYNLKIIKPFKTSGASLALPKSINR